MLNKINEGYVPTVKELACVISSCHEKELFFLANEVKIKEFGSEVKIRGIIEFSNYCKKRCGYCGINCENLKVQRYRMTPEEIVDLAVKTGEHYETIILQSGEDNYYTVEILCDIVKEINSKTSSAITLSIGERSYSEYKRLKDAGANRFLLKHETADENLYLKLHGESITKRIECLNILKELGFEVGGGFMIGLPGQNDEILAKDLLLLKKLEVDMAGIGPYISHSETALKGERDGEANKTLVILALARLLLKKCNLPSTTALNVKGGMKNALFCGANVIMQKTTPYKYRALYDIYPKEVGKEITIQEQRENLNESLLQMGLLAR